MKDNVFTIYKYDLQYLIEIFYVCLLYIVFCSLHKEWSDEFLVWNPAHFGGIDELILMQRDVWLPDIFVENT